MLQNIMPCQVKAFRAEVGLDEDAGSIHLDASGLKKLFSHGIRRFCNSDGRVTARVSWIELITQTFCFQWAFYH